MIKQIFSAVSLADKVAKGVDKFVETKQEKGERFERLLVLYEPFKLAQRVIALTLVVSYVLSHFIGLSMLYFDSDTAILIFDKTNGNLNYAVMLVLGFYFGGGMLEGIVKKAAKKNV